MESSVMTIEEVADYLKMKVVTIYKHAQEGRIPAFKVGSKWRLFVPAELAYGSQNRGPIAPGSTLIFDVELISIEKGAPKQPAAAPSTGKPAAGSEAK